jgi:hypothetical protein
VITFLNQVQLEQIVEIVKNLPGLKVSQVKLLCIFKSLQPIRLLQQPELGIQNLLVLILLILLLQLQPLPDESNVLFPMLDDVFREALEIA